MNLAKSWVKQLFKLKMPQEAILKQIYHECNQSLVNAYSNQNIRKFIQSMPTKVLLNKAVQIYVGSQSCPKNQKVSEFFINTTFKQAKTQSDVNSVNYYKAYLEKFQALSTGNQEKFEESSQKIVQLANKFHPQACYLVGKQMYKVAESITKPQQFQKKEHLLLQALEMFEKSLSPQQYQGIYYIASILQQLPNTRISNKQIIQQMFVISAGLGNPLALLKLALIYKDRKQPLYIQYLKEAAQLGVIEAQHNLGVEYLRGQVIPKDQLKAFAWFMNAGAHNFLYAKYNASIMLIKGSQCGRVKVNKKAALVLLQEIHRSGEINVQDTINQLMKQLNFQQK